MSTKRKFNIGDRVAVYGHTSELRALSGTIYACYIAGRRGEVKWASADGEMHILLDDGPSFEVTVHKKQLVKLVKIKSKKNKKGNKR